MDKYNTPAEHRRVIFQNRNNDLKQQVIDLLFDIGNDVIIDGSLRITYTWNEETKRHETTDCFNLAKNESAPYHMWKWYDDYIISTKSNRIAEIRKVRKPSELKKYITRENYEYILSLLTPEQKWRLFGDRKPLRVIFDPEGKCNHLEYIFISLPGSEYSDYIYC
jgi:hypothetical protein